MSHDPQANQVILVEPLVERPEMFLIGQVQELKLRDQLGDLTESPRYACVLIPDYIPDFITSLKRILRDDAAFLLPSHGPVFRRDNRIIQKAIDRLTQYQYMADFGTCAVSWPLLDEWERDVSEGRMPDFSGS